MQLELIGKSLSIALTLCKQIWTHKNNDNKIINKKNKLSSLKKKKLILIKINLVNNPKKSITIANKA